MDKSSANVNRTCYSSFLLQILPTLGNMVDNRKTHNKLIDGSSLEKKREIIQMNNDPDPLFNLDIHKASFCNKIHIAVGRQSLIKTSFSTIPGLFIIEKEVMNEIVGFTVK